MLHKFPGTKIQNRLKTQMSARMKQLRIKWTTYTRLARHFNQCYRPHIPVETPSFEEVKSNNIGDLFWDIGSLTHADESWAVDYSTKQGIQTYLTISNCHEELRRLGKELLQCMEWALGKTKKLQDLYDLIQSGM